MKHECTEERFLQDVQSHEMTIVRDDGVHRHVRFKRPGSYNMHFDLITWPGYLCYTGDMGTYVFRRLDDMFEFFRTDREYTKTRGRALCINLSYWSEKLEASDRGDGHKKYSPEKFQQVVKEQLVSWWRDYGLTREQRRELREAIENDVLPSAEDGHTRAYDAANDFSERIGDRTFEFRDFWEHSLEDYTFRFVWCCYALAWGIEKYDEAKTAASLEAA